MKTIARFLPHILLFLLLALTTGLYFGLITDGTGNFPADDPKAISYNMLGDAFAHGQTSLRIRPDPRLLALLNPNKADAATRYQLEHQDRFILEDASLFKSRYYLYFGPVPGLLHALFQRATGQQLPSSVCIFAFALGSVLAFLRVAKRIRQELLPNSSTNSSTKSASHSPVMLISLFALGGTMPFLLSSTDIYHEAILTGGFFLLAGLGFWLRSRQATPPKRAINGLLAGTCFALAMGSRVHLVLYAVTLLPVMILRLASTRPEERRHERRALIAYILPLLLAALLLMAYNYQRFGSPVEFGGSYQLVGSSGLLQRFELHLIPSGLSSYLGMAPHWLPIYPFQTWKESTIKMGDWFVEAPLCGLALVAPVALLAPLALMSLKPKRVKKGEGEALGVPSFVLGAGFGSLIVFLLLCCMVWVAMRYMHDFLPVLLLLGATGCWYVEGMVEQRVPILRLSQAMGTTLVLLGIGCGLTTALTAWSMKGAGTDLTSRFDALEGTIMSRLLPKRWPQIEADARKLRNTGDENDHNDHSDTQQKEEEN